VIDPGLNDKVVLITGANHGIGAATARAFAAQGATVFIHFLDAAATPLNDPDVTALHVTKGRTAADELVGAITERGGQAAALAGDLAAPDTIPALFDEAEDRFGRVDVLVNNAAHCEAPDTIFDVTAGTLDRTFAVNMRAGVLLIAEFVRRFQERNGDRNDGDGRIINLSTDAAQTFAGQIAYGASKATMEAFTRSIAIEVGHLGITVNTVAPGPVQTGWMSDELVRDVEPHIPLGRVGTPDDIADAILFLASAPARWLTGNVIKVSGGHEI